MAKTNLLVAEQKLVTEEETIETLAHEWTKVNGGHLRFHVAGFPFFR